jgi:hypothetical protein
MYGFDHSELNEYTKRLEMRVRALEGNDADTTFALCRQLARQAVAQRRTNKPTLESMAKQFNTPTP